MGFAFDQVGNVLIQRYNSAFKLGAMLLTESLDLYYEGRERQFEHVSDIPAQMELDVPGYTRVYADRAYIRPQFPQSLMICGPDLVWSKLDTQGQAINACVIFFAEDSLLIGQSGVPDPPFPFWSAGGGVVFQLPWEIKIIV